MIEVVVEWYDEQNGIGQGVDKTGRSISLNANNISANGNFLSLAPLETILCDVKKNGNSFYASSIKKDEAGKRKVEKDTFVDIRPLEL